MIFSDENGDGTNKVVLVNTIGLQFFIRDVKCYISLPYLDALSFGFYGSVDN